MVSLRCKLKVADVLKDLGINYTNIDLGVIELTEDLKESQREKLKKKLIQSGLVIMDDQRSILIEQIKTTIIDLIHNSEELPKCNYSDYIAEKLHYDYTYLSNIFSETKGCTIQQFIILNKIERVKELLLYNELTLSEIAHKMHYSSTAHLSMQFKKTTGLTPSFYKKIKKGRVKNLEDL